MKQPITEKAKEWFDAHRRVPRGVVIAICVLPVVVVALFYILRPMRDVMDWVAVYLTLPIRRFLGMLSSIYPPALMEILCTVAGIFLIYYIVKAIRDSSRRRAKWKMLGKRALWLLVAFCYVYGAFCWLWSAGYHTTGFAEKNGFANAGTTSEDLAAVTQMFADGANRLSVYLERDEDGNLIFDRREMLAQSRGVYINASERFPSLGGPVYAPKPMYLYSWLMTATRYAGIYFALTGEAMFNTQEHPAYMPATVAHEIAHQLGVFAEDEANFVSIMACVTSGYPVFEYAGYLKGLSYLSNALAGADLDEWSRIMNSLTDEVRLDRDQNARFWANAGMSDLGIDFLDTIITNINNTANDVVDFVYDDYLKSQNQELGLQTYGACVDLLVEHFAPQARETQP